MSDPIFLRLLSIFAASWYLFFTLSRHIRYPDGIFFTASAILGLSAAHGLLFMSSVPILLADIPIFAAALCYQYRETNFDQLVELKTIQLISAYQSFDAAISYAQKECRHLSYSENSKTYILYNRCIENIRFLKATTGLENFETSTRVEQ